MTGDTRHMTGDFVIYFFLLLKFLGFFMVSVLLTAHYERFSVSRMWDFHRIGPLGRFDHRVAMSVVCMYVCLSLFMQFFSRPLIGPQIT